MKMSHGALALNAGAIVIGIASLALIVRNYLASEVVQPCAERYAQGVMFSAERRPGELVTGADLQARLSGRDWGVLENVTGVAVEAGAARQALEVRIPAGAHGPSGAELKAGMSFPWAPRSLRRTEAACLGYQVWFAPGFDFGHGGRLPGLSGGGPADSDRAKSALTTRLAWGAGGKADVAVVSGTGIAASTVAAERGVITFEPGRWAQVEVEVVLNTPGERDGILRVWIDGELKVDRRNAQLREAADVAFDGVAADVIYGSAEPATAARREQRLRITPFELRWR